MKDIVITAFHTYKITCKYSRKMPQIPKEFPHGILGIVGNALIMASMIISYFAEEKKKKN